MYSSHTGNVNIEFELKTVEKFHIHNFIEQIKIMINSIKYISHLASLYIEEVQYVQSPVAGHPNKEMAFFVWTWFWATSIYCVYVLRDSLIGVYDDDRGP